MAEERRRKKEWGSEKKADKYLFLWADFARFIYDIVIS